METENSVNSITSIVSDNEEIELPKEEIVGVTSADFPF
jgi:hypothetical protein